MAFVRSIGRLGLTALVVNTIIGSGIFGVPSLLIRLVGRASPLAMIAAGVCSAVVMLCVVEVASQFRETGGAYLYARSTFGRFVALQIGWFSWVAPLAAAAANANLFVLYLAGFFPWAGTGLGRAIALAALVALPTAINYIGVRSGTRFNIALTAAKLLPLALLITLGLIRFGSHAELISVSEILRPSLSTWGQALLLLVFSYAGYETMLLPSGEVRDPRRTVPFSLLTALVICIGIYTLIQFVAVATIGLAASDRPLAAAADVLIGHGGAVFISIAAMISTYGFVAAASLATPRVTYSLAERGDFPAVFANLHPRFRTPSFSIFAFGVLLWILAFSGSFRWALAVCSGAILIIYASIAAALVRLRTTQPGADAFRVPLGRIIAPIVVAGTLTLLLTLTVTEALLLVLTSIIAAINWWFVTRRRSSTDPITTAQATIPPAA